jgi:hypothetical protein
MAWLVGLAVVLLLIYSSGFRKAALGLVVVGAIGIGIIVWYTQESKNARLQAELEAVKAARERIPILELEFNDMVLKTEYGSYKIIGRIKNNSHQYTLTGVGVDLSFEDCEGESLKPTCVTIGEDKGHYYEMNIPPGQVREISGHVYPGGTRPKGKLVWHYSISYTQGK